MSFRPDTAKKIIQDGPPPGGFPMVEFMRKARTRGPTGFQLWMLSSLGIAFGFYRVGVTNREINAERALAREARYSIAPVLQAEEDLWYHQREQEILKKEAEIMKDVPGWKVGESMYMTSRWVPRVYAELDRNTKK